MKIKISTSPIFNIMLLLIIAANDIIVSLNIPFIGDSGFNNTWIALVAIALFLNCIINSEIFKIVKQYSKFSLIFYILLSIFIVALCFYSQSKYHQGLMALFICFRPFLLLFLNFPLIYIFTKQNGYDYLLKILCYIILIYIAIQMFVATVYYFTNNLLIPNMMFGTRYGRLRCADPAMFSFVTIYIFNKVINERSLKKTLFYALIIVILAIYVIYIDMTRMLILGLFVSLLAMVLFKKRPKSNNLVIWIFAILCVSVLLFTGIMQNFFNTFQESNVDTGNSTIARQFAREYFSLYTKDNPVFSMGFVCPTNDYYSLIFSGPNYVCHYDDLGIANMWYHYGISGVIIATVLMIRLIYLFIKATIIKKSQNSLYLLGLFIFFAVTQISLGFFDNQRIISLVFLWALFEYEANKPLKQKEETAQTAK